MVFQPQSNKKKRREEKEKEEKRRKKMEEKGAKGGEKKGKKIHFISPNQQVFPPGYPRMANYHRCGLRENTVAAVRTSMLRRYGNFLNIFGRLLQS